MSESVAKAQRRDIRRAFGEEAVDAITSRDDQIRRALQRCDDLERQIIDQSGYFANRLLTAEQDLILKTLPRHLTLRQRLSWFVRGYL